MIYSTDSVEHYAISHSQVDHAVPVTDTVIAMTRGLVVQSRLC
jgi:hypothetical protein